MDSPNTPSRPPLYSEPPSYGEENSSTPTGQPSNASQVRLLTSVDEPESRPYVTRRHVQHPLAAHLKKKRISAPDRFASLKAEEEVIYNCKLQNSPSIDISHFLPKIPDGPSRRRSLRTPVKSPLSMLQTEMQKKASLLNSTNSSYTSHRSYQPTVISSHSRAPSIIDTAPTMPPPESTYVP